MKKVLGCLLLCAALVFCFGAALAEVEINETNFPDDAFRAYIEEYDWNEDGSFSDEELEGIGYLYFESDSGIHSLKGIEYFTNLYQLDCGGCELTELDVSGCAALNTLNCTNNQLTSLNVSGCAALEYLYCAGNSLRTLTLGSHPALQELDCGGYYEPGMERRNHLTELNLSGCPNLYSLYASGNYLHSLDVSGCSALYDLDVSQNSLRSLDVSQNHELGYLSCHDNSLQQLTIGENELLSYLVCYNNMLRELDITGTPNLESVDCENNWLTSVPDLTDYEMLEEFYAEGNMLTVASEGRTFDMKTLPGFDPARVVKDSCQGGTISGDGILTLKSTNYTGMVQYKYKLGKTVPDWEGNSVNKITFTLVLWTDDADPVAINEQNFPDEAFRGYVAETFDLDGNGALEITERLNVSIMRSSGLGIADLTGIEYFAELWQLDCSGNALTELNQLSEWLGSLVCADNSITALDLSGCENLWELDCSNNALTELNLTSEWIYTLNCSSNALLSLNVSAYNNLEILDCSRNQLTALDLTKNINLLELNCAKNQLAALSLTKNTKLQRLNCSDNQLTGLSLTKCLKIRKLDCSGNQLTSLALGGLVGYDQLDEYEEGGILDCSNNRLSTLDLSKLKGSYESINCSHNQLTTLTFPTTTKIYIYDLNCSHNQLTALKLSALSDANYVYCSNNRLTTLTIPKNAYMDWLDCSHNQLTTLNLSSAEYIDVVDCSYNALTKLDLSGVYELDSLDCSHNALTKLDLSGVYELYSLDCSHNQLTALDVSNIEYMGNLDCTGNRYEVTATNGQYDVNALTAVSGFDIENVSYWYDVEPTGTVLTVPRSKEVRYGYDCGDGWWPTFTLVVRVEYDAENIVTLPAGLRTVGERAFEHTGAKMYYVPDGVKSIGAFAFANLENEAEVRLPGEGVEIAFSAFDNSTVTIVCPVDSETYEWAQNNSYDVVGE